MNVSREQILEALFTIVSAAKINGQPAFRTASRRFQMWDQVPVGMQPAMFLRQLPGRVDQNDPFKLSRWTLRCGIWIYSKYSPASSDPPAVALNDLIDAVEQTLLTKPGFPEQTLGGLVVNCWLEGEVLIDEGNFPIDDQAIAVLPVSIRTGV